MKKLTITFSIILMSQFTFSQSYQTIQEEVRYIFYILMAGTANGGFIDASLLNIKSHTKKDKFKVVLKRTSRNGSLFGVKIDKNTMYAIGYWPETTYWDTLKIPFPRIIIWKLDYSEYILLSDSNELLMYDEKEDLSKIYFKDFNITIYAKNKFKLLRKILIDEYEITLPNDYE